MCLYLLGVKGIVYVPITDSPSLWIIMLIGGCPYFPYAAIYYRHVIVRERRDTRYRELKNLFRASAVITHSLVQLLTSANPS